MIMLKKTYAKTKNAVAIAMTLCLSAAVNAQHCQLTLTLETNCIGNNSGWAMVTSVQGAIMPYSILWSNGDTAAFQTGLTNGTYTVTVTDASGCVVTGQVTIDCVFVPDCEFNTYTQGG